MAEKENGSFFENVPALTKNPLGIIGLFISLIYGFGSIVITFSKDLSKDEKLPLIWFLVLFPIVVVGAFVYLVVFHHKKLYGPGDYKDEKNFVVTHLPEAYQQIKMAEELDLSEGDDEKETSNATTHTIAPRQRARSFDSTDNDYGSGSEPELLKGVQSTVEQFQQEYRDAERSLFAQLETRFGSKLQKRVLLSFGTNAPIVSDAYLETEHEVQFVMIKYPQFGLIGKNFKRQAEKFIQDITVTNATHIGKKGVKVLFAIGVRPPYRTVLENRLARIQPTILTANENIEFQVLLV